MIFDEKANILTFLQNLHSRQFFSGALLQKPTLVPVTYTIEEYWGIIMLMPDFQNTVYVLLQNARIAAVVTVLRTLIR